MCLLRVFSFSQHQWISLWACICRGDWTCCGWEGGVLCVWLAFLFLLLWLLRLSLLLAVDISPLLRSKKNTNTNTHHFSCRILNFENEFVQISIERIHHQLHITPAFHRDIPWLSGTPVIGGDCIHEAKCCDDMIRWRDDETTRWWDNGMRWMDERRSEWKRRISNLGVLFRSVTIQIQPAWTNAWNNKGIYISTMNISNELNKWKEQMNKKTYTPLIHTHPPH